MLAQLQVLKEHRGEPTWWTTAEIIPGPHGRTGKASRRSKGAGSNLHVSIAQALALVACSIDEGRRGIGKRVGSIPCPREWNTTNS